MEGQARHGDHSKSKAQSSRTPACRQKVVMGEARNRLDK